MVFLHSVMLAFFPGEHVEEEEVQKPELNERVKKLVITAYVMVIGVGLGPN